MYEPPIIISQLDLHRAALMAREMCHKDIAQLEVVSTEAIKSTANRLRMKTGRRTGLGAVIELMRWGLLVWDRERLYLEPNKELYQNVR